MREAVIVAASRTAVGKAVRGKTKNARPEDMAATVIQDLLKQIEGKLDPKEIDVSVRGDILTLGGERKQEKEEKGENFHRVERSYGAFSRSVQLPAQVDAAKVDATYKDGVLKITMPKTKGAGTKKIQVKAA